MTQDIVVSKGLVFDTTGCAKLGLRGLVEASFNYSLGLEVSLGLATIIAITKLLGTCLLPQHFPWLFGTTAGTIGSCASLLLFLLSRRSCVNAGIPLRILTEDLGHLCLLLDS
jgi:hypothetical protein